MLSKNFAKQSQIHLEPSMKAVYGLALLFLAEEGRGAADAEREWDKRKSSNPTHGGWEKKVSRVQGVNV